MKRLIINADDFGIHEGINRGIIYGHSHGAITSTTIMAVGEAFDDAVKLAAAVPALGVGIHLTLVGERPVASPDDVPSLVDQEGRLPRFYPQFLRQLLQRSVSLQDVRTELTAQVERVLAAGINPTHLDSHQHMHVVPGIIDIVLDLANLYKIPAIRIPDEPFLFFGGFQATPGRFIGRGGLTALSRIARNKAVKRGIAVPRHFYGMLAGGFMIEKNLLAIIDTLPQGVTEIMMHPGDDDDAMMRHYGWQFSWQKELVAVTGQALQNRLAERGIELITFRELIDD